MQRSVPFVLALTLTALVVYSGVVFLIGFPITTTFLLAYGFTALAFILQVPIAVLAFRTSATPKSAFLGLPVTDLGVIYLLLQLLWGLFVMFYLPITPAICSLVSIILLGGCAMALIMIIPTRELVEKVEGDITAKTAFIKSCQGAVDNLVGQAGDAELKKALASLRDQFRYSDPVSLPELAEAEGAVSALVNSLAGLVASGNIAEARATLEKAADLLKNRNRMSKSLK